MLVARPHRPGLRAERARARAGDSRLPTSQPFPGRSPIAVSWASSDVTMFARCALGPGTPNTTSDTTVWAPPP